MRDQTEEIAIATGLKPASWTYAENFIAEDEVLTDARKRATEVDAVPIGAGGGATLRFVAGLLNAKNVVEIGTGCGGSGVWVGGGGASVRVRRGVLDAKSGVEVGTGCGVAGVWMMRGMRPDGVLTSVDLEAE